MRVVAAPFQSIAILIALYGAFIFRESWIQYICLTTKNTSLRQSTHGAKNDTLTVPGLNAVSSLRKSKGKNRASRIRNGDTSDADIPDADTQENTSGGAQSRTNSSVGITAPPTTISEDKMETLTQETQIGELAPLRICRDSTISSSNKDARLEIPFQCKGPKYNDLSLTLSKYMNDVSHHSTTWGRRELPFPSNSSILILGNHHLGQIALSLLCQYQDQVKSLQLRTTKGEGYTVEFTNGAVVEALINPHAIYSPNWKDLVERHLEKSLESFDALVLGNFNHLNDFLVSIPETQQANENEKDDSNNLQYTEPPSLDKIASVYSGNMIAISSFSNRKQALREHKKMRMEKVHLVEQGRTNLRFMNGRKFVKLLKVEGTSQSRLERADAVDDGSGHRCNGANGGYPDLMSWEVIEKVNDLFMVNATTDDSTVIANEIDDKIAKDEANDNGLLPLHICQVPEFGTDPDDPLIVNYQCEGPNYDAFSQRLTEYMTNTSIHPPTWGRRPFPLPPNKSVFIFGNSHTRQTAIGILCQYQDQLKVLQPRRSGNEGYIAEFENGAVVESLINNYALYGHNWKDLIEKEIDKPLASFDGIVLGKFNHLKDSQNTTFMKQMQEVSKTNPNVDFSKVKPPGLKQVADVYAGNIVAVGMFSDKLTAETEAKIMEQDEAQLHKNGRNNVRYIYGRKYVDILGLEGGSMNRKDVDDSYEVGMAHRCNGAHGGHPDLMTWEVLENLNQLFSENDDGK